MSVNAQAADRGAGTPHPTPVLSIRWIVSIATVLLTTLVVVSVVFVGERNIRRALTDELVTRLCAQSTNVATVGAGAMLTPFPELTLNPMILSLRERERELTLATVCDREEIIIGDADPRRLGQAFQRPKDLAARSGSPGESATVYESAALLVASAPVLHPNGTRLGTVYLGLRRGYVDAAVTKTRRPVLMLSVGLLGLGVVGSFLLVSTMLRPIGVLRAGIERIGRGEEARLSLDPRTEFGLLAQTINRVAKDLELAKQEAIERGRLAHEIDLAQKIQRSLLPTEHLVESPFVVAGVQRQASEVGGDFYDSFKLPDGRVGIVIADVAGKGLAGCLVTSMLAALMVALRDSARGPADLLAILDRSLSQRLERGVFVTMFVAYLDPRTGVMVYGSAGHHPALLIHRNREQEWLKAYGLPIGASRKRGIGSTLREDTVTLAPGDLVLLTTDGIHEAETTIHEPFGFDRMAATAGAAAERGATAVIDELSHAVEEWRAHGAPMDDETIVVLSWEGGALSRGDDPSEAPVHRVAEARAHGEELMLLPSLEALARIDDWLARLPTFASLGASQRARAVLVLNELCANIVEHGHRDVAGQPISVWWVPASNGTHGAGPLGLGQFVIHDQGAPFSAENHDVLDYRDTARHRRGRGFGIDLVRRASIGLAYHPSTAIGNVTLVTIPAEQSTSDHGAAA